MEEWERKKIEERGEGDCREKEKGEKGRGNKLTYHM